MPQHHGKGKSCQAGREGGLTAFDGEKNRRAFPVDDQEKAKGRGERGLETNDSARVRPVQVQSYEDRRGLVG